MECPIINWTLLNQLWLIYDGIYLNVFFSKVVFKLPKISPKLCSNCRKYLPKLCSNCRKYLQSCVQTAENISKFVFKLPKISPKLCSNCRKYLQSCVQTAEKLSTQVYLCFSEIPNMFNLVFNEFSLFLESKYK